MPLFDADATRRIARTVRRGELAKAGGRAPRGRPPQADGRARWFRTTSAFAAATDDGTTLTLKGGTGALLATARPATIGGDAPVKATSYPAFHIYNGLNGAIASGKVVKCLPVDGLWVINLVWCG